MSDSQLIGQLVYYPTSKKEKVFCSAVRILYEHQLWTDLNDSFFYLNCFLLRSGPFQV